jgi:phospholipid transport system substrate-binding protein
MFRRFSAIGAAAAVAVLIALTPPASAAPDPGAFVNQLGTQGIEMLGPQVPPPQRVARFRQLFQADFDVDGIGRFVIGRYWRAFTPAQQQQFLQLFQEYTVQAYSDRLGQYGGAQFRVTGVRPMGGEIVVSSNVERPNGSPVQIDWHLIDAGGQYKIADVDVDGVSMKATQRDEFARIIENNNGQPAALLAVLRQKIGRGA